MLKLSAIPLAVALSLAPLTGCVGADMHAEAVVSAPASQLVWVAPGVWVIEDYDYPVFWYGDYYWLYHNGLWYRSDYYTGGWVHVAVVPNVVVNIRTPRHYIHYRAPHNVRTRAIAPRHAPRTRDHRAPPPRKAPPARRDHRKR